MMGGLARKHSLERSTQVALGLTLLLLIAAALDILSWNGATTLMIVVWLSVAAIGYLSPTRTTRVERWTKPRTKWTTQKCFTVGAVLLGAASMAVGYSVWRNEHHPSKYGGFACGGGAELDLIAFAAFAGSIVCAISTVVFIVSRRGAWVVLLWAATTAMLTVTWIVVFTITINLSYATSCD